MLLYKNNFLPLEHPYIFLGSKLLVPFIHKSHLFPVTYFLLFFFSIH